MKIDWTTDSAGMLLGFSYHDSGLVGLEWVHTQFLRLRLLNTDGGISVVEFRDLDQVAFQEVWEGMILSEIFVWPISAAPLTAWHTKGAWEDLLSGRAHDLKSEALHIIKRRPSAFLVHVQTSYGGSIALVCEKINVWEEAPAGT